MRTVSFFLALLLLSVSVVAKPLTYQKKGLAVSGYDPVSYFSLEPDQNPLKGEAEFSFDYLGATYHFVSQENLDAFKADPEKYAPQYGGYCAWAIAAKNKLVKTDPRDWKLHQGKLYLNYSANLRAKWEADPASFIPKGDANWAAIKPTLDQPES